MIYIRGTKFHPKRCGHNGIWNLFHIMIQDTSQTYWVSRTKFLDPRSGGRDMKQVPNTIMSTSFRMKFRSSNINDVDIILFYTNSPLKVANFIL